MQKMSLLGDVLMVAPNLTFCREITGKFIFPMNLPVFPVENVTPGATINTSPNNLNFCIPYFEYKTS